MTPIPDALCLKGDGAQYFGKVAETASGKTCLAWNKQTSNSNDKSEKYTSNILSSFMCIYLTIEV